MKQYSHSDDANLANDYEESPCMLDALEYTEFIEIFFGHENVSDIP